MGVSDTKKQMKHLLGELAAQGCTAEATNGGHVKVRKGGRIITIPSTPSDARSLQNAYAEARRVLKVPVYMSGRPKKRKSSADDFAMERLRKRVVAQQERGVGIADLGRLSVALARRRGSPTWKTVPSAIEGISYVMRDDSRRLSKIRHDSLASALNTIEAASDNELARHLTWAAEYLGVSRGTPRLAARVKPADPEPAEKPPLRIAPDLPREPEAAEDGSTLTVHVELGPATRSLLRELYLSAIRR